MGNFDISDSHLRKNIRKTLGLKADQDAKSPTTNIDEAYVTQAKQFNLTTEMLSEKSIRAHFEIFEDHVNSLNKLSAELDGVNRDDVNDDDSLFRTLKVDETYNLNAAFLHGLFFENISDIRSEISMDSLTFMRLERDFGSFDAWQKDFIACAMSARSGWAVTVYNTFLRRYMNVCVDLYSTNIPFSSFPIIVLDCWEHSYYRDYLNERKTYVFAMMKEFDWDIIEKRVKKADKIGKITA